MAGQRLSFRRWMCPMGSITVRSRIDSADGFPADDVSLFAVKRADPERVLFVHQASDARSPLYFGAALAAASQASFTLQAIDSEKSADIDPAKYAFVVLSDAISLPSIFENALMRYVRGGGSVLIAAGTSAAHHAHIPIFGGYFIRCDIPIRVMATPPLVGQTDLTHPAMNDPAGWTDLKIYYVWPAWTRRVRA